MKLLSVVFIVCLSFLQVITNVTSLWAPELRLQGLLLAVVWFCLAFRSAAGLPSALTQKQ